MESYIVRIYRRGQEPGQELAGTVEQVGCEGACSFNSIEELGKILLGEQQGRKRVQDQKIGKQK